MNDIDIICNNLIIKQLILSYPFNKVMQFYLFN